MVRQIGFWLLILGAWKCADRTPTVATIVMSAQRDSIVVEISNRTNGEIVLLSPGAPVRQLDEQTCAVRLSTVVDNLLRPFAFTPDLVTVRANESRRVRVPLAPLAVPIKCLNLKVTITYAYVSPAGIARFQDKTSEEFRQYVLRNQRITSTEAIVAVR